MIADIGVLENSDPVLARCLANCFFNHGLIFWQPQHRFSRPQDEVDWKFAVERPPRLRMAFQLAAPEPIGGLFKTGAMKRELFRAHRSVKLLRIAMIYPIATMRSTS